MQINVSVDDLTGIDLNTVIDGTVNGYDPETGELDVRPMTLADLVAEKLAINLLDGMDGESRFEAQKRAARLRDQLIVEKVKPIIEKALTGPIRLTNTFGEPVGKETTLNELIMDEVKKLTLGNRADHGRGDSPLQRLVKEQVGLAFSKEMAEIIAVEKKKAVDAIRAKASSIIAESLAAGLGGVTPARSSIR